MTVVARAWQRLEGLALLVAAAGAYAFADSGWWAFGLGFLAPDLSMLAYLAGPRIGAAAYNAVHVSVGPLALGAVGLMGGPDWAAPAALIWLAHIGFDRALGFGLKDPSAFGITHLGRIGGR